MSKQTISLIASLVAAVVTILVPPVQHWLLVAHPSAVVLLVAVWSAIAHALPAVGSK